MKNLSKLVLGILLFLVGFVLNSCEEKRPLKNCDTFTELPDPTADTLSDWSAVKKGLNASFVSIDKRFPKSLLPEVPNQKTEKIIGWKGEKLSAQILLWTSEVVEQVEFEFEDFKSDKAVLPASIAQARFVRYVMTDEFGKGCGYRKPSDYAASLSPDMLDNLDCFNLEANKARPVWISIAIPSSAEAGVYKTDIKLYARGQAKQVFNLEVEVIDQTLPQASEWKFHLDQWQHPTAVARTENLEVWSDAHFEAMKPIMKMLADAGQKVITATVNKDPWHNQCYDGYADMIIWTKKTDGSWEYDYTVFDRWINFMLDIGINKMINCYSIVPWNNEIHYKDEKTGEFVTVKADPGTAIFNSMWTNFLGDFKEHQKEKGWLEITNIAMDERDVKSMEFTLKLLESVAPEFGVSYADNKQSYRKYPYIKDISISADEMNVEPEDIVKRQEAGLNTTFYVCCSDAFPNQFTFSDPAESTYFGWYALAANYDGFLRWAFNSWVENPTLDSRFRTWPAGDTYIVYPNSRSSIRFERMVEGIQDYEKVEIVRNQLQELNTEESLAKLDKLNTMIAKFNTVERTKTWNEDLNAAKAYLNEIAKK